MDRTQRFQDQWFGLVLLGASLLAVYHGVRIALRREIDNPLVSLRGPKALAVGLAARRTTANQRCWKAPTPRSSYFPPAQSFSSSW